jgi:predicted transcriptional regulator
MAEQRRPMGSLEAEVLRLLWTQDSALTPAEVCEGLDTDLAYTTITTILTRLSEKGLVKRERSGRGYVYQPTLTESEHAAHRMEAVLATTEDREGALSTFVGSLSRRDARIVRRLMGEQRP